MLAIRMQRTGRRGHAMFRVIVQDSRRTPTSGKVVARLGSYDPHAKAVVLDKEKAGFYLEHGAQPSDRVARLLKSEGLKLPAWVKLPADKERTVRNADKRRSTRPADAAPPEAAQATDESPAPETDKETAATEPAETAEPAETTEDVKSETTAEPAAETASDEAEAKPPEAEKPAEPAAESDSDSDNAQPEESAKT